MYQTDKPTEKKGERIRLASAKDFDISYFVGPGSGGQNKQKNKTGVQLIHRESGAMGRCSETRSLVQNKEKAFLSLTKQPKFKLWLNSKLYEIQNKQTIEDAVEKMMAPENLRIQIKEDGKWKSI